MLERLVSRTFPRSSFVHPDGSGDAFAAESPTDEDDFVIIACRATLPATSSAAPVESMFTCWRCALQCDPCPDGNRPCGRCISEAQKGNPDGVYFSCDRTKLPDFVNDFLPSLMATMYQKDTIEKYVQKEVAQFSKDNFLDVWLTSGYGPALKWRLFEFKPRSQELLFQLQYLQDPATGRSMRNRKYSPPFALLKLDTSDNEHFEQYMQQLLLEEYLVNFGAKCFEEETQIDDFQAQLLSSICHLYLSNFQEEPHIGQLLQMIIRMVIVTYIVGHTLTLLDDTIFGVVSSIRMTQPPASHPNHHMSPRLANRQLKFFFSQVRNKIYTDLLNSLQQFLLSSPKEQTWLPSFCAMLGLAIVLEEQQRTLHIQADAKIHRHELSFHEAHREAKNACERIEDRFCFLITLFQCKYRDRKGMRGSFGNQTPDLQDPACRNFLHCVHNLLQEKKVHLISRRDIEYSPDNQCQYTSRLVARFLLPFLSLPV